MEKLADLLEKWKKIKSHFEEILDGISTVESEHSQIIVTACKDAGLLFFENSNRIKLPFKLPEYFHIAPRFSPKEDSKYEYIYEVYWLYLLGKFVSENLFITFNTKLTKLKVPLIEKGESAKRNLHNELFMDAKNKPPYPAIDWEWFIDSPHVLPLNKLEEVEEVCINSVEACKVIEGYLMPLKYNNEEQSITYRDMTVNLPGKNMWKFIVLLIERKGKVVPNHETASFSEGHPKHLKQSLVKKLEELELNKIADAIKAIESVGYCLDLDSL